MKFFEDEELLKGRHILVENYKAILYPNSHFFEDTSAQQVFVQRKQVGTQTSESSKLKNSTLSKNQLHQV